MKPRSVLLITFLALTGPRAFPQQAVKATGRLEVAGVHVGVFPEEVSRTYTTNDGVPSDDVRSIAITASTDVYAATTRGLARFSAGTWTTIAANGEAVEQVAARGNDVWFISGGKLVQLHGASFSLPPGKVNQIAAGEKPLLAMDVGLYIPDGKNFILDSGLEKLLGSEKAVRQVAVASDGRIAVAAMAGLFLKSAGGAWRAVYPRNATRSWAPHDVRGVAFDSQDRLWFSSAQGVGCQASDWRLYTGADGLPYNDFTTLEAGENGAVWFGTRMGAIRYDGKDWEYRQGRRWLPHDEVRSIAVNGNGDAWFATSAGVGVIERRPMTFAVKAKSFEDEIGKRHRRTPYGYVYNVTLKHPGDASEWEQQASDNDGLWTAMYGAGECFAYAATRDPLAKQRAKAAFEALRFLRVVTQGGAHPAPAGFVARAILPTSGADPNQQDSPARDEHTRATGDALWKVITPRWPISADGKWYWKTDTSSDELDGHFFFYGLYYDLVADTEDERNRVREHVAAVAGHLIDHNFQFVDHDGKPTRWGIFNPENLNHNFDWREERGTNSLSILAYLQVAAHITGDPKFAAAARGLIERHAYAANVLIPKADTGPGSGNQSDDEMIFMNCYNLIRYESDPVLRETYALALYKQWQWERQELNPFFDFIYAASCSGQNTEDAFGKESLSPKDSGWLTESVDSLRRFPLDRVDWRLINSHRLDIIRLADYVDLNRDVAAAGYRVNGNVLPIDERWVERWNHDPWELDEGGNGTTLADGAAFLLPYYMGLYHRYIRE
ncbi:MAG: hypothetical protein ABSF71_28730 [Terriglobia bacterium]|jgi:hypothetical protein